MPEHEQTADRPVLLSEVLEKEYTAVGIPIQIHPADFPEFPKDDTRRLREVYRQAAEARPLSALCISGGGIRSATFSLGVVQGLAKAGLLSRFDYMSTVSGGGYIGSWLSAWISGPVTSTRLNHSWQPLVTTLSRSLIPSVTCASTTAISLRGPVWPRWTPGPSPRSSAGICC